MAPKINFEELGKRIQFKNDALCVFEKAIDRYDGKTHYACQWPSLTTVRSAMRYINSKQYFMAQTIKWFAPQKVEGHSMLVLVNRHDKVLWLFEPLASQKITMKSQMYPNAIKRYHDNHLRAQKYRVHWINGTQNDDERTCVSHCYQFALKVKEQPTKAKIDFFV